jgi:hypothetical protein
MLIAAYSFDESGSTVLDVTGTYDFALTSDAVRIAGNTGGGIQPATTTAVPLPNIGQTDDRTVCMWVKGAIPDGWPVQWYDATADGGLGAGVWGILFIGGNPIIRARNAVDAFTDATAAWPDTINWHHIAGVYGGGSVKLYLDGVLADQQTLISPIRSSNAPTLFGGFASVGSFDDLRVYDAALGTSSIVASMSPVVSSDLASAGALSVSVSFLSRVTAAMQQYGVAVAKAVVAAGSPSSVDKARLVLAQDALTAPDLYGQQFAWALGSDLSVESTVDDDTIRAKVQDVWNVIAKVPV